MESSDDNPGAKRILELAEPASEDDHRRGAQNAAVTIVGYYDFECRACRSALLILRDVEKAAQIPLVCVFRHFPVEIVHRQSFKAAEAAEAAARQGKFWEMHDSLFERQEELDDASLVRRAADLKLNVELFLRDVAAKTGVAKIRRDLKSGADSGVSQTPAFFINNRMYDGEIRADALLAVIAAA